MKILAFIAFIETCLFFVACSDTVTTSFTDTKHAKREDAFERGRLPPLLPPSAKDITEKNNLDLHVGEGSSTFSPADPNYFIIREAEAIKINPAN